MALRPAEARGSILKACEKRSVGVQAVDDVVVEIEAQLHGAFGAPSI